MRNALIASSLLFVLLACQHPPRAVRNNPMERALNADTIESKYARDARQFLLEDLQPERIDTAIARFARDWNTSCRAIGADLVRCTYQTTRSMFAGVFSNRQLHTHYAFSIELHAWDHRVVEITVCLTVRGYPDNGTFFIPAGRSRCDDGETVVEW